MKIWCGGEHIFCPGKFSRDLPAGTGVQTGGVSKEIAALKSYMEDRSSVFTLIWYRSRGMVTQNFQSGKTPHRQRSDAVFLRADETPDDTNYVSPYAGIKSVIARRMIRTRRQTRQQP